MKNKEAFEFLDNLFPVSTAKDYDNPGLLVGDPEKNSKKAVLALDCTLETVDFAVKNCCSLIITHHPVIFSPLKNVLKGSVVYELIRNNIAVISMHTNLDVGDNGVNDCLCEAIGLSEIKPHLAPDGYLLKSGVVPSLSAENLANRLKERLGGSIKYVDGGKEIKSVLVCSGSGGDFIEEAITQGFDALVTADIKHHHFLLARDSKVALFDAGHYNTEDIVIEPLRETLSDRFKDCEFISYHPNTIKYA